jgi:HK97 family phage prohead protease
MLTKDAPALRVKTTANDDGLGEGEFDALVSVFGNIDSYGDVVQPGAFSKSLSRWAESGYKIPVYWGHNLSDPDFNIGEVLAAEETERGLQVRARLDMDSPKAAQVYRLLKGGRVKEFSFGYAVQDAEWGQKDGQDVLELHRLDLFEVSVVPVGANPETELQAVKTLSERTARAGVRALDAIQVKAGRVLSAKNEESLRGARDELAAAIAGIDGVLSALDGEKARRDDDEDVREDDEPRDEDQDDDATEQEPDPDDDGEDDEDRRKSGAPMPDFAADPLVAMLEIESRKAQ